MSTACRSASTSIRCSLVGRRSSTGSGSAFSALSSTDTVDEAHHVERRAVDRLVGAQPERRRHGHTGRADGGDDAVLASHVVRGGQHVAERRAAQHERRPSAPVTL